jgi:hypothetical protein
MNKTEVMNLLRSLGTERRHRVLEGFDLRASTTTIPALPAPRHAHASLSGVGTFARR